MASEAATRRCRPRGDRHRRRRDWRRLIFGNFVTGALRNPSAAAGQFTNAIIGAALAEGLGIFAFLIAILLYLK